MPPTAMTPEQLLAAPAEHYMNSDQQAFFRDLLLAQRLELQERIQRECDTLREFTQESDPIDLGSIEEQRQWQLRLLEREKKLLDKIDSALDRLARDEYGRCEETGEPIGLQRLLLRPTTTLSIEAKQRQEQREKHHRSA